MRSQAKGGAPAKPLRRVWHVYYGTRGAAGAYIDALQNCLADTRIRSTAFVSSRYRFPTRRVHKIFFPFTEGLKKRNTIQMGVRAVELVVGYTLILCAAVLLRPAINVHLADNFLATIIFGRLCIALRLETIITCHDVKPLDHEPGPARLALLRAADRLIVHSNDAAQQLVDMLGADAAIRIRKCGFPFTSYDKLVPAQQDSGAAPISIPGEYLLFAGVIRLSKGIETLIDAWENVAAQQPFDLLIAGKWPPELKALKQRAAALPRCNILDQYLGDDDFARIIANASWAILPYTQYTHSSILFSCLNATVPMIVSDCGLFREMLTGYEPMFAAGDKDELSQLLLRLHLHDIRSRAIERIRQVHSSYELDKTSTIRNAYLS